MKQVAKRFIISIDSSNNAQNKALIDFIKSNKVAWWHWLENSWLIVDPAEKLTARKIRDALGKTHPKVNTLVIELRKGGDTWSGFGPAGKKRNMFDWLKNTWSKYKT